jgi:hypothetical protein
MRNQAALKMTASFFYLMFLVASAQLSFGQSSQPQRVETITRRLASQEFNGRAFKTEGGRKAAEFIAAQFREIGLKPAAGRSDFFQPIVGGGQNVIGVIEGRDAASRNEFVIIGAHYDSFDANFVGAMDNAAGVAVMTEIARLVAQSKPQRSLLFIAFDGGEQRHAGAKFYAEHPAVPLNKTAAAVYLSGFGGGMSERLYETLYVAGAEFSPQLREAVSKHKRDEAHLAIVGSDVMRWPGGEHFHFALKQVPAITVTNGVHYAYHSKADTPNRINDAALEKHVAALAKVILEIANTPGKIERQVEPVYDADEAMEWRRVLTALRENVLKTPANDAGQAQIEDALLELKRHQGRAAQNPKAREAVMLRAANICFYIANPNGVEYNSLYHRARNHEQNGEREQAIAAYQKLLRFIEEEYRRDDQTVSEIRARRSKLGEK